MENRDESSDNIGIADTDMEVSVDNNENTQCDLGFNSIKEKAIHGHQRKTLLLSLLVTSHR